METWKAQQNKACKAQGVRFLCFMVLAESFSILLANKQESMSGAKSLLRCPLCMSVWRSLPPLSGCNVSCSLCTQYVRDYMSHLFDVPVVNMTFLFVNPNSIDTICSDHDAVPCGSTAHLQAQL